MNGPIMLIRTILNRFDQFHSFLCDFYQLSNKRKPESTVNEMYFTIANLVSLQYA